MSKLGELAKQLANSDPFEGLFFDRRAYEERRKKEEPEVIEEALWKAKKKQDYEAEKKKAVVFTRDIKERYWE